MKVANPLVVALSKVLYNRDAIQPSVQKVRVSNGFRKMSAESEGNARGTTVLADCEIPSAFALSKENKLFWPPSPNCRS